MNGKIFLFGIGGTGSRVIKSLVMIAASGVDIQASAIVPIIIDPDFANADLTFNWHGLGGKGNVLTIVYDILYTHSFPLFSEVYGNASTKMEVPTQTSHDMTVTYAMHGGKYNLSVECHNITDAKLYDNFNLQKAGRAFYGKIRVFIGK